MHKNTTAVVIDDDMDTVDVFCEYLQVIGVDVKARGHDGRDAVELYEQYKPDIVFLDLVMPEFDGLFALANIKKIDPASNVAVITANLNERTAKKLQQLGPNKIIQKPFEAEEIFEIVEQIRQSKLCKP
jgi:DNA-binding NtrC family response regulator